MVVGVLPEMDEVDPEYRLFRTFGDNSGKALYKSYISENWDRTDIHKPVSH